MTVPGGYSRRVVFEVGAAIGWDRDEVGRRWAEAAGPIEDPIAGGAFRAAVRALAVAAGRDPGRAVGAVGTHLARESAEYDRVIAEKEVEIEQLTAELRAARERAAAAAVYADARAADTVIRLEGHLTRQLGLTLDLLDQLRGERPGSGRAGFAGLLRGLAGGSPPVVVSSKEFVS